jgi:hypothetical protein
MLVATIHNVPDLSPVLDLFSGICLQNQRAEHISLDLDLDNAKEENK